MLLLAFFAVHFSGCSSGSSGTQNESEEKPVEHPGEYWPTQGWLTAEPEAVGMDSEKLAEVYDHFKNTRITTQGYAIIKDGYIVSEGYFPTNRSRDFNINSKHGSFSMAKSYISALIGIAIEKGYIDTIDDTIDKYFTQDEYVSLLDEEKKNITIKHLLTMTSGIEWSQDDTGASGLDSYWSMIREDDWIQYVLSQPMAHEPGKYLYYSDGSAMLLSGIIQSATGMTAYEFAMKNLFEPIGVSEMKWTGDAAGHTDGGDGIRATVREYAKFGYLYLKEGEWDGRQIVPASWVRESVEGINRTLPRL